MQAVRFVLVFLEIELYVLLGVEQNWRRKERDNKKNTIYSLYSFKSFYLSECYVCACICMFVYLLCYFGTARFCIFNAFFISLIIPYMKCNIHIFKEKISLLVTATHASILLLLLSHKIILFMYLQII